MNLDLIIIYESSGTPSLSCLAFTTFYTSSANRISASYQPEIELTGWNGALRVWSHPLPVAPSLRFSMGSHHASSWRSYIGQMYKSAYDGNRESRGR